MKINLKISTLILLLTVAVLAKGQLIYQKGYIVNLEKDTIYGLIKDRGEIANTQTCLFKADRKSDAVAYAPTEIQSYGFISGKRYRSMEVVHKNKYKTAFVEGLIEGKVNLYHFWRKSDLGYFIENEDGKIVGLVSELYTLKKPSTNSSVPSQYQTFQIETYKDTLESVFNDCKEMTQKIDEVEYEIQPLMRLTKEYINCTCSQKECIRYEKDLRTINQTAGFFTGLQVSKIYFLSSSIESNSSTSIPVGAFVNMPFPKLNDRLSFQAELIYTHMNYKQGFINLPWIYSEINISSSKFGLPLSIKYKLPFNKFSASIGAGKEFAIVFNSAANTVPYVVESPTPNSEDFETAYRQKGFFVHNSQKQGWFFDLGFDYRATPKFDIFCNLRLQSYLNLIIEEENYNNYQFHIAAEKNLLANPHSNIYRTNAATLFFGIKF